MPTVKVKLRKTVTFEAETQVFISGSSFFDNKYDHDAILQDAEEIAIEESSRLKWRKVDSEDIEIEESKLI